MGVPLGPGASAGRPDHVDPSSPTGGSSHPLEAFHRSLGQFVVSRHDTLWCGAGRFTLVTFPNNQPVSATKRDIGRLLVNCGRLAAVFCPRVGSGPKVNEYRLRTKDYGLGRLQRQFRRHVLSHGPRFVTRDVTWKEMAEIGVPVHADIAARRGGIGPEHLDPIRWTAACEGADATPGLDAFGCFVDDALAGYVVDWRVGDVRHGVRIERHSGFDALRGSNVLLYEYTRDRIGRADTAEINLGRSWYPPRASLDGFKRHAGYDETGRVLAVVLHPRLETLLGSSFARRCLAGIGAIAGRRAGLRADLDVLNAARLTDIP